MKIGGNPSAAFDGGNLIETFVKNVLPANNSSNNGATVNADLPLAKKPPEVPTAVKVPVKSGDTPQKREYKVLWQAAKEAGLPPKERDAFARANMSGGSTWSGIDPTPKDGRTVTAADLQLLVSRKLSTNLHPQQIAALQKLQADYVARGGALDSGAKQPHSGSANANGSAAPIDKIKSFGTSSAVDPIRVVLIGKGDGLPVADRALRQHIQDKFGTANLGGTGVQDIFETAKLNGVRAANVKPLTMGDKTVVTFDLKKSDADLIRSIAVVRQERANQIEAIANKFRDNNEAASFLRGFGEGVWSALKNNWEMLTDPIGTAKALFEMVSDPIKTLESIKQMLGDKWTEFQNADQSKKAEMLGQIAGELAVDALLTKGAGKVAKLSKTAEMLRGTKIGESILSKADDAARAAKAKIAATFSDDAAAAAAERARRRLATQLYTGIPADVLADMTIVAGNKVAKGAVKFAEFSKQMVQEFGEQVKPKLLELYQESIEKVFGKRKDLELDELLGGHTIERHVGKSDNWLRNRLLSEPEIKTASTFRNEAVANRTIAQFVKQNRAEIEAWLKSGEHRFEKDIISNETIGSILSRGKGGAPLNKSIETNKARISIVRDNTPQGWHVQTSFPIMPNGKVSW